MKNKLIFTATILIGLLLLDSCNYEFSDPYHAKIEKRPDEIPIRINLSEVAPDNVIYIYSSTSLYLYVDAEDRPFLNFSAKLDDQPLRMGFFNDRFDISINKYGYGNERCELTVDIEIKSNSGSMADKMYLEKYTGHFSFPIQFVSVPDINLHFRQEKTPDKHLKIVWDNPVIKGTEVDHYEVNTGSETITVYPSNPSFVDYNYVYGYKSYPVTVYFKTSQIYPIYLHYTVDYQSLNSSNFIYEYVDLDKMKISWPANEYACKYVLRDFVANLSYTADTSAITYPPSFPSYSCRMDLYILPENASENDFSQYHNISIYYRTPRIGGGFSPFLYEFNRLIYSTNPKISIGVVPNYGKGGMYDVYFIDLNTLKIINTIELDDQHASNQYNYSPVTGKIAFAAGNNFYIYPDNTLTNPLRIEGSKIHKINYMVLADNDRLLVIGAINDYIYSSRIAEIYDAVSGNLLYTIPLEDRNELQSQFVYFSQDGKYFCIYTKPQLTTYQLNNDGANLLYKIDIGYPYINMKTNPANTNELIFYHDGNDVSSFVIMDIPTHTVRKEIPGLYVSIDPCTGNIARYDNRYSPFLDILTPDATSILRRVHREDNADFVLLNNYLFYGDYYMHVFNAEANMYK